jgi:peptidoglycan hydrolase-like protein with peptidoglycan-binding domain
LKSNRISIIFVVIAIAIIVIGIIVLSKGKSDVVSSPSACANNSLLQGSSGSCVSDAQNLLNWSLYGIDGPNYKTVTGQFNNQTSSLVKQYQASNGLSRTGSINRATWQKLCSDGSDSTATWAAAAKNAGCKA